MGIIKTKGIVIAEHNMGDYDKMLTLLTPGLGKISCAAKGARRPKSSLLAGSQYLCFGEYILYKGASSYNINSCDTIEVFYNVRIDLDKLEQVAQITKLVQAVTAENQNSYKILQLLLNTVYVISQLNKDLRVVNSIFKLRLMHILGFGPRIQKCCNCEEKNNLVYFSFKDKGLKCRICAKQDKGAMQIKEGTQKAIKYAIIAPQKKLYSFNIPEECIKELEIISKLYVEDILKN